MSFWKVQNKEETAELQLYGEISNSDSSWWDGAQYITPQKFLDDIAPLREKEQITIKLNSGGGDLFVGLQIATILKSIPAKKVCIIEGIAASAAVLIACACDTVKLYSNSLLMVHKPKATFFSTGEDSDFDKVSNMLKICKDSCIDFYRKKTGKSYEEMAEIIDKETWFLGQEAVDFGFCDEVIEENLSMEITNSHFLIVNSIAHNLTSCKNFENLKQKINARKEGKSNMTIETLKKEYPDLYNQVLLQERNRLKELDEFDGLIDTEMLHKAKYLAEMSAKDLCFEAMKQGKITGVNYWNNLQDDRKNSGAHNVMGMQEKVGNQKQEHINYFAKVLNQKRGVQL